MSSNIEPSIFTYFNQNSSNDRAIKSLIGLTRSQFDILVPKFEAGLHEIQMERVTNGEIKRLPSGGKSGFLHSIPLKLFFILFYLKNYPTFDVLAAIFMFSSGDAHGHVEKLFTCSGAHPSQARGSASEPRLIPRRPAENAGFIP